MIKYFKTLSSLVGLTCLTTIQAMDMAQNTSDDVVLNFAIFSSYPDNNPIPQWASDLLPPTQFVQIKDIGIQEFKSKSEPFYKNLQLVKSGQAKNVRIIAPNGDIGNFYVTLHQIINSTFITDLTFSGTVLDRTSCMVIADALKSNTTLQSLTFTEYGLNINLFDLRTIMEGLKENKTVHTLSFRNTHCLGTTANCGVLKPISGPYQEWKPFNELTTMLSVNTGLKTLILNGSFNWCDGQGEEELSNLAKALTLNKTIISLDISHNMIGQTSDMRTFMRILSGNSTCLPSKIIEHGIEKELQDNQEFDSWNSRIFLERHFNYHHLGEDPTLISELKVIVGDK